MLTSGTLPAIWTLVISVHPEMANLPDIGVARKIYPSEYYPYASGLNFASAAVRNQNPFLRWLVVI